MIINRVHEDGIIQIIIEVNDNIYPYYMVINRV